MTHLAGYPCVVCGYPTSVYDSRRNHNDHVRRRRKCNACKTRFTTYELPAAELDQLKAEAHGKGPTVADLVGDIEAVIESYQNGKVRESEKAA